MVCFTLTGWQVYVTILASLTSPAGLRSSVNRNLADIVELHEEILDELRRAVPDSEYSRLELQSQRAQLSPPARCHRRWRSMDAVPEDQGGISWSKDACGLMADPQTVAEVAKVFLKKVSKVRRWLGCSGALTVLLRRR